ncbi:MAG: phosphatidylglycerophosphatase A [Proteobacteria bacterium]|nr:MAG: phosphatidylglycerophosphatase A [Pseudomonadota bacterium]
MSPHNKNASKAVPLPPWNFFSLLAVAYPLGMLPKAPGTWGSLLGIPLAYGIVQVSALGGVWAFYITLMLLSLFTVFSLWVIARTEAYWQTHDDGRIVIDEVLGQAIVSCFFPFDLFHIIAAFILFRIFDIFKPGPIGWADRKLPGAWGTLLDDVIAGIFAALVLLGLSRLLQNHL